MHPHFFHWHTRAEIKPDPTVLEARWNAAAKFVEKAPPADLAAVVQSVLFAAPPDFAKRFGEAIVKAEPTFPPDKNAELIRVMAAAAAFSAMEKRSPAADAVALGLLAATFDGRGEPVCDEVPKRATEYLQNESEEVRPTVYLEVISKAEEKIQAHFGAIKKAAETNALPEVAKSTEGMGRGLLAAVKESHEHLGRVIDRMAEETQFLWWLLGKRSSILQQPRDQIDAASYALIAAAEGASRVAVLPPPPSAESLLQEVLAQAQRASHSDQILEFVTATSTEWKDEDKYGTPVSGELTPITFALNQHRRGQKLDTGLYKQLHLQKSKVTAFDVSRQFFRERMLIRALAESV